MRGVCCAVKMSKGSNHKLHTNTGSSHQIGAKLCTVGRNYGKCEERGCLATNTVYGLTGRVCHKPHKSFSLTHIPHTHPSQISVVSFKQARLRPGKRSVSIVITSISIAAQPHISGGRAALKLKVSHWYS